MIILHCLLWFFSVGGYCAANNSSISTSTILPTYLALAPNINDFGRFADGGNDSNWYIGFNNAWLVQLPPAPFGEFSRAFIGAKIGRAKTRPMYNKPWQRELIAGKIYMGISQTASFSAQQSFFLAETSDLPVEADPQAHLDGVGSGEWFWAEVPLTSVSFSKPNYLIIWSPTNYFVRASSSPILAAAAAEDGASRETRSWNNHSITGVPPRTPAGTLETPLNNILPALAIKLTPPSSSEISVSDIINEKSGKKFIVRFSGWGENIEEAWVEYSRDSLDWERLTRFQRHQPFIFSIPQEKYPPAGSYLRGVVRDSLGNTGASAPYSIPYVPQ